MKDGENAGWKARFLQSFGDTERGEGRFVGRLPDVGVAERERDRDRPHRNHRWKVKRSDVGDHAEGFATEFAAHAARDFELSAQIQILKRESEVQDFHALHEAGLGLVERLSTFSTFQVSDLILIAQQDRTELNQDFASFLDRGL